MNLAFHIARRYLFSKKSHNAINIISMVSVFGVAAATIAMVCTLSVFNGFQDLLTG
ncbi:MAG: ABC transporter permease, partial [Bacteroidales bacterium]|nr:ABC transporter permease [Bacteroidales bacterium]